MGKKIKRNLSILWHGIIRNSTLLLSGRLFEHVIISYKNNFINIYLVFAVLGLCCCSGFSLAVASGGST